MRDAHLALESWTCPCRCAQREASAVRGGREGDVETGSHFVGHGSSEKDTFLIGSGLSPFSRAPITVHSEQGSQVTSSLRDSGP